jgi:O-antigen/teichoic acid export membrane protein
MSKFVSSSIWNFIANFIVRVMSVVTFPFLVKYFLKEDISLFKSFQSFVLILLTIIPLGTNILYLSAPQDMRDKRWNLFFNISLGVALLLALLLLLNDTVTSFFIKHHVSGYVRGLLILFPIVEGIKVLAVTKLSSIIDFKGISIALIIKQLALYAGVILFAFFKPTLTALLYLVFTSEILELFILLIHTKRQHIGLLPLKNYPAFLFDKTAKKYVVFSGIEQTILTFAMQFPTIYVVTVMGETLAPEFQLPFSAVALPVSLVMNSVARVSFPHYSNLRDDDKIINSLFALLFPVTLILFPTLIGIHFFAREITYLFFDKTWQNAVFALQTFPLLMFTYILGVPSTFISNIKQKPQINLYYSIALLVSRLFSIAFGYRIGGFSGVIICFILGDLVVRFVRLKIDIGLLSLSLRSFFSSIKYNLLASILMLVLMWGGYYFIHSKILAFTLALLISLALNYYWENERIKSTLLVLWRAVWK